MRRGRCDRDLPCGQEASRVLQDVRATFVPSVIPASSADLVWIPEKTRASTFSSESCFRLVWVRVTPGAVGLVSANGAVRGPASADRTVCAAPASR